MTERGSNQEYDTLIARIEWLLLDNHAIARNLELAKDENSRLLAAIARTEGENAAFREMLDVSRSTIESLGDKIARHLATLAPDAYARPVPTQSSEANEAAERLHAVLTSRSWRLTRPLRGVGRILNRLRN